MEFKLFNLNLPKAPPKGIFAILFNKILIGSINELLMLTKFNSSSIIDETFNWFSMSLKSILSRILWRQVPAIGPRGKVLIGLSLDHLWFPNLTIVLSFSINTYQMK